MEKSQEYVTSDTAPDDYLTSGGIASKYFLIFCYSVTGKFSNFMQNTTISYLSKIFSCSKIFIKLKVFIFKYHIYFYTREIKEQLRGMSIEENNSKRKMHKNTESGRVTLSFT